MNGNFQENSDNINPEINSVKVIDTTFYSDGFPNEKWDKLIQRSNYLSQIDAGFVDTCRIVFIEGE